MARKRLLQLDSLDQRDGLRKLFAGLSGAHRTSARIRGRKSSRFSARLRVAVDASGAPLDPSGAPYVLRSGACEVDLDPKSEIPVK